MEIVIASDQERENLFAEIRVAGQPLAEVILNDEKGRFELTIFPSEDGSFIVTDFIDFQNALGEAKQALAERGYKEAP